MAIITGHEYDHIDIINGNTQTRHMLKDASARADIASLNGDLQAEILARINAGKDFQRGMALEASLRDDADENIDSKKIPYPEDPLSRNGNAGQFLRSLGNGKTEWTDAALPSYDQISLAVSNWLDDHPESTTSIQDRSLTNKKLLLGTLGFVMPEMFGAKCDGVSDDSDAIQEAINYAHNNGVAFMGSGGTYGIGKRIDLVTVETYDNQFLADFNGSTLKAISQINEMIYIDTAAVAGYDTPGRYMRWFRNCILDGNGLAKYGIHDMFGRNIYINSLKIVDVTDTCILAEVNEHGGGMFIENLRIDHNLELYPRICGLDLGITDAKISHVAMRNVNKAVILRKGSCFLTDIHPYLASIWSFDESICFDVKASSQHFDSCYADTYEVAWNLEASQHIFVNCQVYWAMSLYPSSAKTPVIFNLLRESLADYIIFNSFLFNSGSYYNTTGKKVHMFGIIGEDADDNDPGPSLTNVNLYDFKKNSAYANWNSLDNLPIVADYYSEGNLKAYNDGKQVGAKTDLNTLYTPGRYYTSGQNLPQNSPISGQNFEVVVEYMLDPSSQRRKQIITTQYGIKIFRTCDTDKVWNNWSSTASSAQGTVGIPFVSGGSSTVDIEVIFDEPFIRTPAITLTPIADTYNVNYTKLACVIVSVDRFKFTVRGIIETPTDFTANIKWIAII